jgi:hypothetical protein
MSQRQQYQPKLLPDIDRRMAVWQAYLNCVNAFQGLTTESATDSAEGVTHAEMSSSVSMERFAYCLAILDGQVEQDKDDAFKNKIKYPTFGKLLVAIENEVESKYELFNYWTELDQLMKKMNFFKAPSRFEGHL